MYFDTNRSKRIAINRLAIPQPIAIPIINTSKMFFTTKSLIFNIISYIFYTKQQIQERIKNFLHTSVSNFKRRIPDFEFRPGRNRKLKTNN